MSQKLADFMVTLAVDAGCAQRFHADPAGELTRAGLSEAETAAVLSGDSDKVRTALGRSFADHLTQTSNKSGTKTTKTKKGKPVKKRATKKAGKKR
jgi:hypothetical protein